MGTADTVGMVIISLFMVVVFLCLIYDFGQDSSASSPFYRLFEGLVSLLLLFSIFPLLPLFGAFFVELKTESELLGAGTFLVLWPLLAWSLFTFKMFLEDHESPT